MFDDEETVFKVVVNHEGQYSLWPDGRDNPAGWLDEGTRGSKAQCLDRIGRVWVDMRPASLRSRVREAAE
jgi:MbtH protein